MIQIHYDINGYKITNLKQFSNDSSFGIEFRFETDCGVFLVKYYLTCSILVGLISSISFMIDPKDASGRAGLNVILF